MSFVLDTAITGIALIFLSIVGAITTVAIPSLFAPLAAPLLELLLPERKKPNAG